MPSHKPEGSLVPSTARLPKALHSNVVAWGKANGHSYNTALIKLLELALTVTPEYLAEAERKQKELIASTMRQELSQFFNNR